MTRTYSELITLSTFEERFKYLKLDGIVGRDTFGFDRYFNQKFYNSKEWKQIRRDIIVRDNGCDLAHADYNIYGKVFIHHMNPVTVSDISECTDYLTNPDYLICVSFDTHNAIHFGSADIFGKYKFAERYLNDTAPWRNGNPQEKQGLL